MNRLSDETPLLDWCCFAVPARQRHCPYMEHPTIERMIFLHRSGKSLDSNRAASRLSDGKDGSRR